MKIIIAYELISPATTKICTKLQNCNFEITVIFYPVIITLCRLFGCVSIQISNLRAKINFANMLKIIQKSVKSRIEPKFLRIRNESKYKIANFKLSANFCCGWGNQHIYGDDLKYEYDI